MNTNVINTSELYLGIDGGGSKCRAVLVSAGNEQIIGRGLAGPANPFNNYEQTISSIIDAAKAALIDANLSTDLLSQLYVGVGLAGVNLPKLLIKMQQWKHPFNMMHVTTDLQIACLGAHDGKDGAILISGTGSCGFSALNDTINMVGAHGFPHGDKGSGAWLGLEVVKKVLLSVDCIEPPSLMTNLLFSHLDCQDELDLVEVVAKQSSSFFAKLAFIAFEGAKHQDPLALSIIKEGALYISDVARRLWLDNPPRMSLIGGLSPQLTPWLDKDVQERLSAPIHPPEMGAVIYAKQQLITI